MRLSLRRNMCTRWVWVNDSRSSSARSPLWTRWRPGTSVTLYNIQMYHTMLLFMRSYRLLQFISYMFFFWELWEVCLRTRPPPQKHWTTNWLMNPKCDDEFKFQDIKITRCPSSHGDMYLIITFYGSITITFTVTPNKRFGVQTSGQLKIYIPLSPKVVTA